MSETERSHFSRGEEFVLAFQGTLIRGAAALVTAAVALSLRWLDFYSLFWSFLLCHFILALVYAVPRFRREGGWDTRKLILFLALNALWIGLCFQTVLTIDIYFGLHFALTEAYMFRRRAIGDGADGSRLEKNLALRALWSFLGYCILIQGAPILWLVPYFLLTALAWRETIFSGWHRLPFGKDLAIYDALEVALVAGIAISGKPVYFVYVIFYHLVVWYLAPVLKMRHDARSVAVFSGWNVVLTALLFLLTAATPFYDWFPGYGLPALEESAAVLGFMHITMTFMTSDSNPRPWWRGS